MRLQLILSTFLALLVHPLPAAEWTPLFDGTSLRAWRASENPASWSVQDGCIVASGPRSHLFYTGPAQGHEFRNFELKIEAQAAHRANSGIFIHTAYQDSGWPAKGYEIQINNSHVGHGNYRELKRTGSLYGVRNITSSFVGDNKWFTLRIRVTGKRVRIHVNDQLTVDYLESDIRPETTRRLSSGTIALQAHDPDSSVRFRKVAIRPLPETIDATQPPRASADGYGATRARMDTLAAKSIPFVDYHVHLRGGMTVQKAVDRQAVTGINLGVLRNIGAGWPIETDTQLRAFLAETADHPVFVGLQVNDRDWHTKHDTALLKQLDFVLADTMIMPMPDDDGPMVKLFKPDTYTIDDPEAWMPRYVKHNLRVLAEPCTILANPTYLPPSVAHLYDQLWTDERMQRVIRAAIANNVALEINATSGYPHARFIRHARKMGAKFTFGSNNFDDVPIDMSRCFDAVDTYKLSKSNLHVPSPK